MKKYSFIIILSIYCLTCLSEVVTLYKRDKEDDFHRSVVPTVRVEDDVITVTADSLIRNVEIRILDATRTAVYSETTDLTPAGVTIYCPATDNDEQESRTINISYDDKSYEGIINN